MIDSDILIFPTIGEGLPRTVIEAMAVGLPCLSTAVNGIPELLDEEFLVGQQDVVGFAKKTIELLADEKNYRNASQKNVLKAAEYEHSLLQQRRNEFYLKLNKM